MDCNERGMALVNLLLILSVLLIMADLLAEKVWQSTRQTADANHRQQVFWAAQSGIEAARQSLAADYVSTGGWQTYLTADTDRSYPSTPAWLIRVNGIDVEIFLRDNPDGDGDLGRDNDLKIFVLARARGRDGMEAMVESLCGLTPATLGAGDRSGLSASELAGQPVTTYGLAD